MQDKESDKITAFDTLFTTDHIRMCKILLPYLNPKLQQIFALYIKLSELAYTLSFFRNHPFADMRFSAKDKDRSERDLYADFGQNIIRLCNELVPYSSPAERQRFTQLSDLFCKLQNMQDMMEMLQMMQGLFPEGGNDLSGLLSGLGKEGSFDGSSFDLSSILEIMNMMQSGKNSSGEKEEKESEKESEKERS